MEVAICSHRVPQRRVLVPFIKELVLRLGLLGLGLVLGLGLGSNFRSLRFTYFPSETLYHKHLAIRF